MGNLESASCCLADHGEAREHSNYFTANYSSHAQQEMKKEHDPLGSRRGTLKNETRADPLRPHRGILRNKYDDAHRSMDDAAPPIGPAADRDGVRKVFRDDACHYCAPDVEVAQRQVHTVDRYPGTLQRQAYKNGQASSPHSQPFQPGQYIGSIRAEPNHFNVRMGCPMHESASSGWKNPAQHFPNREMPFTSRRLALGESLMQYSHSELQSISMEVM